MSLTFVDNVTPLNATNMSKLLQQDMVVVAATRIVASKLLSTDTQPAFQIAGDGKQSWGPGGATAVDTDLYRSGVGILATDSDFNATGAIRSRFGDASGQITLARQGGTNACIFFGSALDANLYRSSAGLLATDSQFRVGYNTGSATTTGLYLNVNGTVYQVVVGAANSGGSGWRQLIILN